MYFFSKRLMRQRQAKKKKHDGKEKRFTSALYKYRGSTEQRVELSWAQKEYKSEGKKWPLHDVMNDCFLKRRETADFNIFSQNFLHSRIAWRIESEPRTREKIVLQHLTFLYFAFNLLFMDWSKTDQLAEIAASLLQLFSSSKRSYMRAGICH